MQRDAYANYQFYSNGIGLSNGTSTSFNNLAKATFIWQCLKINASMAKLNVSLTVGENDALLVSGIVYANVTSREVFSNNGTFAGVTFL